MISTDSRKTLIVSTMMSTDSTQTLLSTQHLCIGYRLQMIRYCLRKIESYLYDWVGRLYTNSW